MVAKWLRDVDRFRKWKKASPTSSRINPRGSSYSRLPNKNAAAIVRDVCEMSISLDASNSKWDFNEMSLSRSNNPFTSSGNLAASLNGMGSVPNHNASNRGMMGPPSAYPSQYHSGHNMNSSNSYNSASNIGFSRRPLPVRKVPTQDEYEEDFEQVDPYDQELEFKQNYKHSNRHGNTHGSFRSSSDQDRYPEERKSNSSFVSKFPRK